MAVGTFFIYIKKIKKIKKILDGWHCHKEKFFYFIFAASLKQSTISYCLLHLSTRFLFRFISVWWQQAKRMTRLGSPLRQRPGVYIHNNMIVTMRTKKETEMQISRIPTRVFLILCCRIVQGKKWIFGINPCTINCSCEVVCVSYITQLFQTKFGLSRETREKGNVTGWRERGGGQ